MHSDIVVLILTPDLTSDHGGVANYFNVLRLHECCRADYFHVNSPESEIAVRRGWRLLRNYVRFLYRLLTTRYDLLHINPSLNPNSFFRDGIFIFVAKLTRTPVLVFFRGWDTRFESAIASKRFLRAFFRLTYGRCQNFIVLGECFRRKLTRLHPRDPRIWTETTVADRRGNGRRDAREATGNGGEMIALFMSRLLVQKGVLIAIDAVNQYLTQRERGARPMRLRIAGSGAEEKAVREYVRSKELDFVDFLGDVRGREKRNALESADILLFPTMYPEGLSNVVLEAMTHGLPVVTRPEGAIGEIIRDGVNGFITESVDPGVFSKYLRTLATDNTLYREMTERNLEESVRFSRDQVASRVIRIYEQVSRAPG